MFVRVAQLSIVFEVSLAPPVTLSRCLPAYRSRGGRASGRVTPQRRSRWLYRCRWSCHVPRRGTVFAGGKWEDTAGCCVLSSRAPLLVRRIVYGWGFSGMLRILFNDGSTQFDVCASGSLGDTIMNQPVQCSRQHPLKAPRVTLLSTFLRSTALLEPAHAG